jgi:hypothetical protein
MCHTIPRSTSPSPAPASRGRRASFISGQLASRIYHVYYTQDVYRVHVQERAVAPDCAYGDSRNLRTVEFDNLSDRPVLMEHADGRQDQYTYTAGNYGSGVSNAPGTFTTSATGAYTRVEFVENVTHLAANKSVKTVTIENEFWQPMLRETWVCTAGGASPTWERVDWQVLAYDADGHETGTHYANGLSRQSTWDCCGKTSEVEPDGQTTIYVLDALGRVGTRIQQGVTGGLYGAQADIQTHFEYDAEGRVLEEIVSADGLSLTATRQYDGVGRVTNEVQQGGLTTRHFYAAGTKSSSSATVYLPSGAQQTRLAHADGRTRSQSRVGLGRHVLLVWRGDQRRAVDHRDHRGDQLACHDEDRYGFRRTPRPQRASRLRRWRPRPGIVLR